MKKILTAALTAGCAMALSVPAQAAITVNAPTTVSYGTPTGDELDFTFGYEETGLDNPFTAVLDFTNTLAGIYSFTLSTSASAVNFTSALLSGGSLGAPISIDEISNVGPNEYRALSNLALDAGNYVLTIQGTNAGAGSLGGTVSFAAVPEPATWALMILGFALVGGAMRRREREPRVRYNFA